MPTIVLASTKGGCGKSTSAVLLATELATSGYSVAIIDADPNQPISLWAARNGTPDALKIISQVDENTIIDVIEAEEQVSTFVIIDLEGSANMTAAYAISRADLVIVPTQGSLLDAMEAMKSVALVKQQEKAFSKQIPYAVLLTRTSAAVRSRTLKDVVGQITGAGVPTFKTEIFERDAFRAIFSFGGTLRTLDPKQVSGIDGAIANALAFTVEVLQRVSASNADANEGLLSTSDIKDEVA
jgi:chromosome partitioning protein